MFRRQTRPQGYADLGILSARGLASVFAGTGRAPGPSPLGSRSPRSRVLRPPPPPLRSGPSAKVRAPWSILSPCCDAGPSSSTLGSGGPLLSTQGSPSPSCPHPALGWRDAPAPTV